MSPFLEAQVQQRRAHARSRQSAAPLRRAGCIGSSCPSAREFPSPCLEYSHMWPHPQRDPYRASPSAPRVRTPGVVGGFADRLATTVAKRSVPDRWTSNRPMAARARGACRRSEPVMIEQVTGERIGRYVLHFPRGRPAVVRDASWRGTVIGLLSAFRYRGTCDCRVMRFQNSPATSEAFLARRHALEPVRGEQRMARGW